MNISQQELLFKRIDAALECLRISQSTEKLDSIEHNTKALANKVIREFLELK